MSNWWDGKALDQVTHERINAEHYPGTRELCCECDEPTGKAGQVKIAYSLKMAGHTAMNAGLTMSLKNDRLPRLKQNPTLPPAPHLRAA